MSNKECINDKIFFNKYKPEKKIGEGSFGKIYSAINVLTKEKFALKLENKIHGQNLLEAEAYVLCYLKGIGIPVVKSYGFSGDNNVLVMELLGKSLEEHFQECSRKFNIKTVCLLADQMISRIEYIHNKNIIHRDIKPDNFLMGMNNNLSLVYLIDFGLAKKFRSSNYQHIKFATNKKLTGTARYASINALGGSEQSRRDDLEAIGYVLMYFLKGSLPWQGLNIDKPEDRYKKICEKKMNTSSEVLCQGFPKEFEEYIKYTRGLGFEQDPDYNYLRNLFKSVMNKFNYINELDFEWLNNTNEDCNITTEEGDTHNYVNNIIIAEEKNYKKSNSDICRKESEHIFISNQANYKFLESLNYNRNDTMNTNLNTNIILTKDDDNIKNIISNSNNITSLYKNTKIDNSYDNSYTREEKFKKNEDINKNENNNICLIM